jgi:CBS domain-containing protein
MTVVKVKGGRSHVPAAKDAAFELDAAMKIDPYTVSCEDTLEQAVKKFIDCRTSGLPVVDEEKHIVGFISDGDVLRYIEKQDLRLDAELYSAVFPDTENFTTKAKKLLQMSVMEIASKHIISAPRDMPLLKVCRLFTERRLNKLPVTQDGVLVGTISRGDIMRALMMRLPLSEEDR